MVLVPVGRVTLAPSTARRKAWARRVCEMLYTGRAGWRTLVSSADLIVAALVTGANALKRRQLSASGESDYTQLITELKGRLAQDPGSFVLEKSIENPDKWAPALVDVLETLDLGKDRQLMNFAMELVREIGDIELVSPSSGEGVSSGSADVFLNNLS